MTSVRSWSTPWLVLALLAAAYAVYQVALPLAPMGDEVYQVLALAVVLVLLAVPAALFHSKPILSASVFSALFTFGVLGVWFKIAHEYRYAYFGAQFRYSLVAGSGFYALTLALCVCARYVAQLIRSSRRAA